MKPNWLLPLRLSLLLSVVVPVWDTAGQSVPVVTLVAPASGVPAGADGHVIHSCGKCAVEVNANIGVRGARGIDGGMADSAVHAAVASNAAGVGPSRGTDHELVKRGYGLAYLRLVRHQARGI